jgi:hypothetical protein
VKRKAVVAVEKTALYQASAGAKPGVRLNAASAFVHFEKLLTSYVSFGK